LGKIRNDLQSFLRQKGNVGKDSKATANKFKPLNDKETENRQQQLSEVKANTNEQKNEETKEKRQFEVISFKGKEKNGKVDEFEEVKTKSFGKQKKVIKEEVE
jgi:hypothetical protein